MLKFCILFQVIRRYCISERYPFFWIESIVNFAMKILSIFDRIPFFFSATKIARPTEKSKKKIVVSLNSWENEIENQVNGKISCIFLICSFLCANSVLLCLLKITDWSKTKRINEIETENSWQYWCNARSLLKWNVAFTRTNSACVWAFLRIFFPAVIVCMWESEWIRTKR